MLGGKAAWMIERRTVGGANMLTSKKSSSSSSSSSTRTLLDPNPRGGVALMVVLGVRNVCRFEDGGGPPGGEKEGGNMTFSSSGWDVIMVFQEG